jgi:SagB-type dehydrogenase family enzyme
MVSKNNYFSFKHLLIALAAIFLIPVFALLSCRINNGSIPAENSNSLILDSGNIENSEKIIELTEPSKTNKYTLYDALLNRRSVRDFSGREIEPEKISMLLWAAQGITEKGKGFRTAPSAGALYPLDVFLFNKDGVFQYLPDGHKLLQLRANDMRNELFKACLFQGSVAKADTVLAITAVYERTTGKYGNRGIRYADIEAGHVCQNILLAAVSLELGAVPIGAFEDDKILEILNLSKKYTPIYIIPIGYPEK